MPRSCCAACGWSWRAITTSPTAAANGATTSSLRSDAKGHIVLAAWKELKDRCRVRRFWAREADEVGHVVHKRGGIWAFHYDIHGDHAHDESGFRFERHASLPGEYVSIREQDDALRTFRVVSVREID